MEKRYTVKLDAYWYAENDEQAKIKAAKLAELLQNFEDNNAQVIELKETPYGSFTSREVESSKEIAQSIIENEKKKFFELCEKKWFN